MPVYRVIRQSDGEEITRYVAGSVVEELNGIAYPQSEFDHIELVPDTEPIATVKPADWRIYVGSFFDRFGAYKIPILASEDAVVQALIKDASVRRYIDLEGRRDELQQLVGVLQTKGFPVDPGAILDVVPSDEEIYRGE